MGDWHQAYGPWSGGNAGRLWRSPTDSINDPDLEWSDAPSDSTSPSSVWKDTGYGTQYQGSNLDNATALRASRTGQALPLPHVSVASAQAVSSGTPWHAAEGPWAGSHAGQFWKSPSNSINDPKIQWSTSDPSGGAQWQESGLGFRYKSPSGNANDPNVVIDPYVPAQSKTLSPQEAEAVGAYMKSQEPKVTQAPQGEQPAAATHGPPPDGSGNGYDPEWEPYFQQLAAGIGGNDTNGVINFFRHWVMKESPHASHTFNAFGLTEPAPGSYISEGVSTYPDLQTGVDVMLRALTTHGPNDFGRIGDALRMGDYCGAARLIHQSGWAEGDYTDSLLSSLGCTG